MACNKFAEIFKQKWNKYIRTRRFSQLRYLCNIAKWNILSLQHGCADQPILFLEYVKTRKKEKWAKILYYFVLSCIVWCRWWYTFLERLFSRKYKRRTRWSIFLFYVWHNIKERITILCIFCCLFICSHKYLLNDSKHNWINVSISEECICNDEASDVLFDMRCSCILFALFVICVNGCLFYILFVFICVA